MGKTSLIESLVGRANMKFEFFPGIGKFFMQGFDPEFHKIIIFEEFNINFYKGSFLKRLLEGRKYAYPIKYGLDSVFNFKGPTVFVSNNDIRDECYDYALLGRLKIVHANCCYWQGVRNEALVEVKVEIPSPAGTESSAETISSTESV